MKPSTASEQTIFDAARQLPDAQSRAAYLDSACAGDAPLRERIERLLQAGQRADEFLAADPLSLGNSGRQTLLVPPLSEGPGTVIGNYKLLEKLGEGGFGVVYMAEQKQPIKRRVALKIIKVGMDTREVVARFEAERQALALMDHPNIAKVFDAGATGQRSEVGGQRSAGQTPDSLTSDFCHLTSGSGRPYFVMELVRGIRITDYCDEKNLSTRERLDLFTQVCQAVQHAHQKGIIHRDLKPSNILVTVNDGVAVPKIIDFGIAKATQLELTEKTVFTRFHQFLGTPAYMSPEQAELTSVDIDTRSDIYSLGVLLYELLTGKTPFDATELLKAGLDAMRRVIREKEPERPSTRLTRELARQRFSAKSEIGNRKSEIDQDLDWIVMKCLEKDRARRYETANGLAMDVQRHLNNEPVVACPPSNLYRLQKLVRRNKLAFAAGAGIAAALVIGLAIALWQSIEKTRAYKQAQTEATKNQQVARLLKEMLNGVGPAAALGEDTKLLRGILDKADKRLGNELTNQPEVEADLRSAIGSVYFELWEDDKAMDMYQQSLDLLKKAEVKENDASADALHHLAILLGRKWKHEECEKTVRDALAIYERLHGREHTRVGLALSDLASTLGFQGKLAEAEAAAREALRIHQKLQDKEHPYVGLSLSRLGQILEQQLKLDEADSAFRDAVVIQKKALGSEPLPGLNSHHVELSWTLNFQSKVLIAQGKLAEAEKVCRESLATARMVESDEHQDIALFMRSLAGVLILQGKLEEAESLFRHVLEIRRKKPGDREFIMLQPLMQLRAFALKKGQKAEAQAAYDEILAIVRRSPPDVRVAFRLVELTERLLDEKNFEQAELRAQDCIAIYEKAKPNDSRAFRARVLLVATLLGQKKFPEAQRAADDLRKTMDTGDVRSLNALAWSLATSPHPEGRNGRLAVALARKAVAVTVRTNAAYLDTLAASYAEAGDFAQAVAIQKEAMTLSLTEEEKKELVAHLILYESGSPYRERE